MWFKNTQSEQEINTDVLLEKKESESVDLPTNKAHKDHKERKDRKDSRDHKNQGLSDHNKFTGQRTAATDDRESHSILDSKMRLKGMITSEEDLVIKGQFTGEIYMPKNRLVVKLGGRLEANVVATSILVEGGEVKGDLYAKEINIADKGRVTGNLITPKLSIEKGAEFKGNVDMDNKSVQEKLGGYDNKLDMNKSELMQSLGMENSITA